ncbi:hypothetical protein EFS38_02975 [Dickeya undicola]|uniref:Decapping nuclease n=1 Tax=Dickeya undicola TaxID=1577887 RepID=A0ABX9WY56_9GAMM|nr:hypothetical protein [Dickeya undicola]RNM26727.1 hypothetical protein EFS38_02975 [Dickeya undicola]
MVELFDRIINPKVKSAVFVARYGTHAVTFQEKSETKLERVTISGLDPDNTLAFTLDFKKQSGKCDAYYNQLSKYFNKATRYINKGCDIVILTKIKSKWYLIVSDMKSERIDHDDVSQLENSECFLNWVMELAKMNSVKLCNKDLCKKKPEVVKVIFKAQCGARKNATRIKDQKKPEIKDGIKIFSCAQREHFIHINSLLSN